MRIIFLLTKNLGPSAFEIGLSWLHQIAGKEPDSAFLLLTDKTLLAFLPANVVVQTIPTLHPWFPFITERNIKRIIRKWNPDGMVLTSDARPLRIWTPQLVLYIETVQQEKQSAQRKQLMRHLGRARFLVFPSQETATSWQQLGELPAKQLRVVAPVPSPYFKGKTVAEKEQYQLEHTTGCSYFMLTGPPKSVAAFTDLLKAFSIFKKRQQSSMKLVIPFDLLHYFPHYGNQLDAYKFRDELIISGEIDSQQRADFAAAAYALIRIDGCDLAEASLLESMQVATPILITKTAAAVATAESSALYVTPASTQDLAEKMMLIYKDERLRNELIAQGQLRKSSINLENQILSFSQLLKSLAS